MSAAETRQMSAAGTTQMCAGGTEQMSADGLGLPGCVLLKQNECLLLSIKEGAPPCLDVLHLSV